MVEPILYASAGFLVATLLWLLFLPVFWRRAARLTANRLVSRLPLSKDEIVASQDRLRAELAMAMRTVERRAEKAVARSAAERIEAARARATELDHLATTKELKARVAALEAEGEALRSEIARLEKKAEETHAALGEAKAVSTSASDELAAARLDADAARAATDQARIEVAAREAELAALREELASVRRTGAGADVDALKALRAKLDEVADAIAEAAESAPPPDEAPRAPERIRLVPPVPERAGAH